MKESYTGTGVQSVESSWETDSQKKTGRNSQAPEGLQNEQETEQGGESHLEWTASGWSQNLLWIQAGDYLFGCSRMDLG